jgi:hypothetical protein
VVDQKMADAFVIDRALQPAAKGLTTEASSGQLSKTQRPLSLFSSPINFWVNDFVAR